MKTPPQPLKRISINPPPNKCENTRFTTFFIVFCDFFKSYGSKPLTLIMFFVVLWEVVSPLRAIFDIMTQNRENRKKRVPKWPYFGPFEAFLKVKYSKNQGDDFEWFFKVVLMVLELYPGYGKVSLGLKECIPNLRTCFWLLKMRLSCSFFESSISKNTPKNTYKTRFLHIASCEYWIIFLLQESLKTCSEIRNRSLLLQLTIPPFWEISKK